MKAYLTLILLLFTNLYATEKNIFVLQSYNQGLVWTDNITKGIQDTILNNQRYELSVEYMDAKKNNNKEYLESLYDILAIKFKRQQYDVVIACDNEAVEFVLQYEDELFSNIPVIFCGLDTRDKLISTLLLRFPNSPIILENKEIDVNIDFITQMLPDLKKLYIINDYSSASLVFNYVFEKEAKKLALKGIQTTLDFDGNLKQLEENLQKLPKNSAVLFGSLFQDKDGNYIPYYKLNNILKTSKSPVFSLTDSHFKKGVIGGKLSTGYPIGELAAKEALKLLNATPTQGKPILAPSVWSFDYDVLNKYGLSDKILPKDSYIINSPLTFFQKNQTLIQYVFIGFPIVLIILLVIIVLYYLNYKLSTKLKTHNLLQEILLNNIHSSVFWTSQNQKIVGCNLTFCRLLELEEKQIVGTNIMTILLYLNKSQLMQSVFEFKQKKFSYKNKIYNISNQIFYDHLEKENGVVSVITDITQSEQFAINRQFAVQQSKLSEIGSMLSAIAHQWKNPLVELSAIAHKMLYYSNKNKLTHTNVKNFYDSFMKQTIYMSKTIDGFRDFIKPSNKPVFFRLDSAIQDALTLISHSMKYSNITLDYENKLHKSHFIQGYPNEFKQVLLTIINNASDSIKEEKIKNPLHKGYIKISVFESEDCVCINIEDNGIGIKQEVRDIVFEPFFTTKQKGDGFGLYMAHLIIVNKMEGKIQIVPTNKGARIEITLPKREIKR